MLHTVLNDSTILLTWGHVHHQHIQGTPGCTHEEAVNGIVDNRAPPHHWSISLVQNNKQDKAFAKEDATKCPGGARGQNTYYM
jgi:hypothetical protein